MAHAAVPGGNVVISLIDVRYISTQRNGYQQLIFAILIASLGLNVNSTAVIIGAMLISPLMGPIIGMGTLRSFRS